MMDVPGDLECADILLEFDETCMSVPDMECEPQLLISKVRKHYMDYVIKLLSVNYETHQKLLNKKIYLPSAIWRCAKNMETAAAQACMVVQIYRKQIISFINDVKKDTKKGRLNKKLFQCLNKAPENEKKTQTNANFCSECNGGAEKKKRKKSTIPCTPQAIQCNNNSFNVLNNCNEKADENNHFYKIPVALNLQVEEPQPIKNLSETVHFEPPHNLLTPKHIADIHDTDELMMQLEKLFQGDTNDDDIFEGTMCETLDKAITNDENKRTETQIIVNLNDNIKQDSVIENHAAKIKSLDERLETLAGMLVTNNDSVQQTKPDNVKTKVNTSKWICEEYFLKVKLFELLDKIGDTNRKELNRIKVVFLELFGEDSDDEWVVSPLDETPEFVSSCKERIAPWVVKLLTPHYIKGRIRGKALFKSLAKHLIRLIYQCSRYPQEYEVKSFVSDFLRNHKMIRCEADFRQFRIDNI